MKSEEELIWESYMNSFMRGEFEEFPLVFEGLIVSTSLQTAESIMQRNLTSLDGVIGINSEERGVIKVYINEALDEIQLNYMLKVADMLGYYPAGIGNGWEYKKYDKEIVLNIPKYDGRYKIFFEAKYDKVVYVRTNLYHVTTKDKSEKIKKLGLTPKSMSKISEHPDRIYLAINESGVEIITDGLRKHYKNKELVTLKINIDKIRDHKFMKDPNFIYGVYTYQNIHPAAIEVI